MSKIYLDAKSIKITILDSDSESTLDSDCNLEIVVRKSLLQNLFSDFAAISEENIEFIDCHLTSREKQVLKHISLGKNNLEIAKSMNVSVHTAKVHVHNIFSKLLVTDRTEAVVKAIKYRLIEI